MAFNIQVGLVQVQDISETHIAQVRNSAQLVGAYTGRHIDGAHDGRLVAHLSRSMARASAAGQAAIIGDANDTDIHLFEIP